MIIIVIGSFTIIALMDMPELIKNRYRLDLVIYLLLFILALIFSLMLMVGAVIPSPIKWFEHIIKDVLHLNYR
jgi:hypothetical protein